MTTEDVIQDVVGIKPGAGPVTPMDYLECKVCMERYAAQEVAKEVEAYKRRLIAEIRADVRNLGPTMLIGDIALLIDTTK